MSWRILLGDCRDVLRSLSEESIHACVTSPPYWGLRDYGVEGQLGLERTPEEYVARMVEVFREVRRVLRPDGTLWLNLGDCYVTSSLSNRGRGKATPAANGRGEPQVEAGWENPPRRPPAPGLKPKDLVGIPWRVAFALQADGWFLRQEVIWHKPNPMPEAVFDRPTRAHEQVFLLSKSASYFYDADAVREDYATPVERRSTKHGTCAMRGQEAIRPRGNMEAVDDPADRYFPAAGRNRRSVWTIATKPFPGAHFATFPTDLVQPCILAGTSEQGACPACGAPFERITGEAVEIGEGSGNAERRYRVDAGGVAEDLQRGHQGFSFPWSPVHVPTVGWQSTCSCLDSRPAVPCVVLDPFAGAGTTGLVARRLGRHFVGAELNPAYIEMARARILGDAPLLNATGTEGCP